MLRLVWEIADSVVGWAARLVLSPVVWLGLVVAGVSLVLFVVSGWLMRRAASRPAVESRPADARRAGAALPRERGSTEASGGDDMADVEEILRKHGIR